MFVAARTPPTPILAAQKIFYQAGKTHWNHELNAASKKYLEAEKRRQLRYNDYLPEDDPGSYIDVGVDPEASTGECLSPLQNWFVSLIKPIGADTWNDIVAYNITSLAYLYKHHISNSQGANEYFGTYGDRTNEMKENHASLTTFWSTASDDVVLLVNF